MKNIACGILAGGAASRLGGTEKALVDVGGRPLLATLLDRLRPHFASIVISTNKPDLFAWTNLPCAPDILKERSALAGLHGILSAIRESRALVIACDMPRVSIELAAQLAAANADVALPVSPSGDEPLHAVYARSCLPAIERAAAAGRWKMTDFMAGVATARVKVDSSDPFFNVNTPEDLEQLRRS